MRHSSCCYHVSSFMNRANETIVRFATCVLAVAMICVPTSLRAADTGRLARVRQADGTTLSLRICGDEFFHYAVTSDGYSVDQGPDGFYYYLVERDGRPVRSNVRVSERGRRTADETRAGLETGFPTTGEIRSVVILAAFSDVGFTVPDPQRAFERMLNEEGYSDNGALGSARDYYLDNSGGRFRPTFDVVGPVTLDHPVAYYGANTDYRDENAERMIIEACHKAERAGVDFSQYDFDNDGKIDNVFVYYAGHNESDGGGMNTVWPHRGEISYPSEMLGGKELCVYACTSELSGSPDFDSRMAGIGTFCHEFGHVLGWPDFYDTNGSDFGTGVGVFNWSLMCQGSRNDGGRTPPSLTAMERMMAGWLTPTTLTRSGDYELNSIQQNEAYLIATDTEGEFFLLENRQQTGWDRALKGHGMLIYHVDRSQRIVEGYSARDRWTYNMPNDVAGHPCFRLVTARPDSGDGYEAFMPYPGETGNTEFSAASRPAAQSWSGASPAAELYDISESPEGVIRFSVRMAEGSIEDVRIEGRQRAVAGDTILLRAIVMPSGAVGELAWSSSDETVASVDGEGVVHCLRAGMTTVRAVAGSTGAAAAFDIEVVDGRMLRGRVCNGKGEVVAGATIEMSDADGERVAAFVSGDDGCFTSEVDEVTAGDYSLLLTCEGYPEQAVPATVTEGMTLLEVPLLRSDEFDRGDGTFEVAVQPFERSAFVTWSASEAEAWRVQWRPMDSAFYIGTETVAESQFDIDDLERQKDYVVRIAELSGQAERSYRIAYFTTAAQSGRYAGLALQSEYAVGMEIAAVLAVAAVMTACEKGGETVENGSPECEAFLAAATEYGLYSDGVPVRVFCRTEDQLVRDSEGTTLRIQNTEQSSVLACTFSSRPQSGVTIVARYEGTGFALKAGSAEFEVVKTADTKAWLWCETQGLGIVADTR